MPRMEPIPCGICGAPVGVTDPHTTFELVIYHTDCWERREAETDPTATEPNADA